MAFTYFSFDGAEGLEVENAENSRLDLKFKAEDKNTYTIALYAYSDKQKDFLKNLARALEPERLAPPQEPGV